MRLTRAGDVFVIQMTTRSRRNGSFASSVRLVTPRRGARVARRDGPHSSSTDPHGLARMKTARSSGELRTYRGNSMRTVALLTSAFGCLLAALCVVPAVASAGPARLDQRERAMIRNINHERARYGLAPVRAMKALNRAADH